MKSVLGCLIIFCFVCSLLTQKVYSQEIVPTAKQVLSQFLNSPFDLKLDESHSRYAQLIVTIESNDKEELLARGGIRIQLIRRLFNEIYQKKFLGRQKDHVLQGLARRPLKVVVISK